MIFAYISRLTLLVVLLCLAVIPSAAQDATPVAAAQTQYPVTIENCGQQITFTQPPRRVITSSLIQASFLLALEQDAAIIGMYSDFLRDEPERVVAPDVVERLLAIPVLGEAGLYPSREVPIALGPDFYYADNPTDLETSASREDYATIGANVFMSTYGCTDPSLQTIDMFFEEILTLGVIFDAQAQAEVLVDQLRSDLAATAERVQGLEPVRVAFIESFGGSVWAVGNGVFTDAIARAGGESLFDGFTYDTPPALEVFAASNPDVILYWDINPETVNDFDLATVFVDSPAIVNERVIEVRYLGGVNLRIAEFVDALARALHPEAFADATPEATTAAAQTEYPVTIENCGRTLTFNAPPDRVLATWQNTAEIMLALGLEDKLVGVYFGQPYAALPEYEGQYDSFSIFPQRQLPSRELIVSAEADFVFSAYPTFDFSAENGLVTAEEFLESGANVYGLTDQCIDNPQTFSLDNLYQDILNIGIIFDVQAQAQAVVADMQGRIAAVQERVNGREPVDVIMVDRGNGPIGVWGHGYESVLIELAGGRNLFGDADGSYVEVGIEAFATQDPDLFIVYDYEDAEGVPDEAEYAAFLFETFPNMRPSQEQRYALIGAETNTGIRAPLAVERLAQQFHPEAFE